MGFDNDCILNIQSVAPEYFCPMCRTLVYPTEAFLAQCTHLYCKPCLVHIASGAQTCPYDGNLITEAGAKPVTVINRTLADAIGKIAVRCLYHRSGCMWQGPLSECIVHRSGCAFGDSQVMCMKCQIQIAHRQAEEHAQICNVNVMNPEVQQGPKNVWNAATSGAAVSSDQIKTAIQGGAPTGHLQASQVTPTDNLNQPAMANPQPQALPAMVMSTSQWYQPQSQDQSQVQARPQISFSGQHGPPLYPQAAMPGSNGTQGQLYPQQQVQPASFPHVQIQTQNQLLAHGHLPPHLSSQALPHAVQGHAQQHMQVPQFQQSLSQVHHSQLSLRHPDPQPQSQQEYPHSQQVMQVPPQEHPHSLHVPPQQHPHSQQVLQAPPQQHPLSQPVLQAPPQQHPHSQPVLQAPPQQHSLQVHPSTVFVPLVQVSSQFSQPIVYLRSLECPQRLPSRGQAPGIPPVQQHTDVKHGAGVNDDHKPENEGGDGYRKDEAVIRDAVTERQEGQQVSCYPVATQRFEGGMNNNLDHFPGGNLVQNKSVDVRDAPIYSVKQVEVSMNMHPPTHFKLAEHGRFSNPGQVSNLAEHFHPPAPNRPGSSYPQHQLSGPFAPSSATMLPRGPDNFANHARSLKLPYEGLQRPYSHAPSYGPPGFVSSSASRLCYEQARAPIGKHPDAFQMESARHLDQGFPHQQQLFGDSSGTMSASPCPGGPGSQSSYTHQGFPNAGPHCTDGSDSFDNLRKRKAMSMGWCRICNVDCESVQGLEMHGQTCEHQRMALNMVNNIKQKSARIAITSNAHSGLWEASKLGSAWSHGYGSKL